MLARKTLRGRGQRIENASRLFLVDAKRYDDEDVLREELESLPKTLTYKIFELQRCPKCKKEFTEYPAQIMKQKSVLSVELGKRSRRMKSHPVRVALC